MHLVKLVLISAFLSGVTAALDLQQNLDPHLVGSSPINEQNKPVILKFSLLKDGMFVRSCYGAHIDRHESHLVNWILPAECLDTTKYDMIAVKYGYKQNHDAKFYLKNIYIRIHPFYDESTKAHNIGVVILERLSYMDPERGYNHTWVLSSRDLLDNKVLELYEYKNIKSDSNFQEEVLLHTVKTKMIHSIWCKLLYPLSPIKRYHICASGWYGKGLSKEDLGIPLIIRDGTTFKVVGLATTIRPWAHSLSFPMEFLSLKPYVNWILFGTNNKH